MRSYELIAESKSVDGKVPASEVAKFMSTHYGIAPRTRQLYMRKKILPKPKHRVWKSWFYETEVAKDVLGRAYLIKKLKEYRSIPFSMIKNIFQRHKDNISALIEKLLTITNTYQWYESDSDPYELVLSERNAKIMRAICEKVAKGAPLESINATDIEMNYIRKES
ncbi:MAG: hypothetical protein HQ547_04495 [Candidatus Omnitrophica bacterium]|nr:hypothetical protein [Candidatus Omnitrophota bacterium]